MNGKAPLISVIIPVYNTAKYLPQCLDSIVNQTLRDIEIICVDDGSTDNSLEILQQYAGQDKRFTLLQQPNRFAGVARNAGMDIARGAYLSFLDSDDFFAPDMLEKLYHAAKAEQADMVVCDFKEYKESRWPFLSPRVCVMNSSQSQTYNNEEGLLPPPYEFLNPSAENKLFDRNFIVKNHIRFQDIKSCNDLGFTFCAASVAGKIAFVREALVNYRCKRPANISHSRGRKDINIIKAYLYVKDFLSCNRKENMIGYLKNKLYGNIALEISKYDAPDRDTLAKKGRALLGEDYPFFAKCFHYDKKDYRFLGLPLFERIQTASKTTYVIFGCLKIKRKIKTKEKQS